jgi:hypothetical protein
MRVASSPLEEVTAIGPAAASGIAFDCEAASEARGATRIWSADTTFVPSQKIAAAAIAQVDPERLMPRYPS